MIEKRQMTVENFLAVMLANKEVYLDFSVLPDEQKILIANVNIRTGTAMSYFEDGKLLGVGGVHYVGVGEGWLLTLPEIRKERKLSLFKTVKTDFEKQRNDLKLWRVFATSKISTTFLKHLDFKPAPSTQIWNRVL
jgi:hypothetical protein